MEKAFLEKITYQFSQEGNTDGTTDEYEDLSVEVQSGLDSIEEKGGYLVLRTSTGWSFNDPKELMSLLRLVTEGVPSKK